MQMMNDYKIKYQNETNKFSVIVKRFDDLETSKQEVLKFTRLMKLLNRKEDVAYLFELFAAEGFLVYSEKN